MGQKKSIGCPFFQIFHKKLTALMPIYFQKKVNSLKNILLLCPYKRPFSQKHGALMSFFQIFHEKAPAVMPILGQKNVNSIKTTLYYGPRKSIGCFFFFKNVHSLINKPLSCPYFVQKTSMLSKTRCSHVIFFQICHEKPSAVMHIFGQKTSILSKLYYIMG